VLPAWATVVLSLISAAAGIAGGVVVTKPRIGFDRTENALSRAHETAQQERHLEHDRSEQWVDRLVRAADDFSTGIEQAILGVRDVIAAVAEKGDVEAAKAEAKRRVHEAVARVARIELLFGEDTEPARIAKDLLPEIDVARAAADRTDPGLAWETLEKIYGLHAQLNRETLEVIRSHPTGRPL
jgi:hypothetical protein